MEVGGQSFPSCHRINLLSVRTVQNNRGKARPWRARVLSIETSRKCAAEKATRSVVKEVSEKASLGAGAPDIHKVSENHSVGFPHDAASFRDAFAEYANLEVT
jgi:hypothetical protein